MAYRSSATAFSNSGGVSLEAIPSGVAVNDVLLGFFVQDVTGHASEKPAGWTDQSLQEISSPDGQTWDLYSKVAVGGDSFATATTDANSCRWITAAWSGRDTAAPISDLQTANRNVSTASPLTVSTANATTGTFGVTAAEGDDVAVYTETDQLGQTDVWDASALAGYTERQDVASDWMSASFYTKDAVAAGGEGALSMTLTRTSGAGNTGWGTFVVSLKSGIFVPGSNSPAQRSRLKDAPMRLDAHSTGFPADLNGSGWF